jgi:RNA 2',3'-cyclic 3'-phosphodiesterase
MPRLFIGLEVPPEIAGPLSALRGGLPGARWSEPSDYHLTLRFIGDIDRRAAREIEEELADIDREALQISFTGLGTFGGDKPHTLYAGVAPTRALIELQGEAERLLRRLGLKPEPRKFTPHVTLARLRAASVLDVADYLAEHGHAAHERFTAERFALFSARETFGGGPYIVEAAYPLQEAWLHA